MVIFAIEKIIIYHKLKEIFIYILKCIVCFIKCLTLFIYFLNKIYLQSQCKDTLF